MFKKAIAEKFIKGLEHLQYGSLGLTLPDGRYYRFEGKHDGLHVDMNIIDWSVPSHLISKGDCGLAEDYRDGLWDTTNLADLMTFALQNESAMDDYLFGSRLMQFLGNLSYNLRLNTLTGSRKNIHAHYDLGNDFYKLWLDPSMTYSSAIFSQQSEDLTQAQLNKYDRIIQHMEMNSGSVLEVGCGWGGFAERAMTKGDFKIKGITLSDEQHAYARERLGKRASVDLEDYRIQKGKFDSIVSIEMFEAVGEKYWPTYFGKVSSLLSQKGRAVIQTITIDESRFERYRRSTDFIRSFIFPGGMLPSPSRFEREALNAGLRMNNRFDFGQDYAKTLELWLENFDSKKQDVVSLGYDEGFIKLWRLYLASCIAGFRTGRTNVMQVELQHA